LLGQLIQGFVDDQEPLLVLLPKGQSLLQLLPYLLTLPFQDELMPLVAFNGAFQLLGQLPLGVDGLANLQELVLGGLLELSEVGHLQVCLLEPPQSLQVLFLQALQLLGNIKLFLHFSFHLHLELCYLQVSTHSVRLSPVVVAHLADEGPSVHHLQVCCDAGEVEVLGVLHGEGVALHQEELSEEIPH